MQQNKSIDDIAKLLKGIYDAVQEKEQKDFMMENYKQYSDKMEFWHIKEVKGDSKVKKKIATTLLCGTRYCFCSF